MLRRFLPTSTDFFAYFERLIRLATQACEEFESLTSNANDLVWRIGRIKEIEHDADDVTHECIEALHKTFITPIDRDAIHRLIKRMDDIVDAVDAAAARIVLYEIGEFRPEANELAQVLVKASTELEQAVRGMRNLSKDKSVNAHCIAVHQCENDGDALLRKAISRLFAEEAGNPLALIKWKEIFERLEGATDRCEEVANIIEGVVLEAS
ncbi:DUF47 family protein [Candidatus Sumerlaeota bacterium]|nr:DUF47 family protein [Candidatus Sumerlaeota bacterium]